MDRNKQGSGGQRALDLRPGEVARVGDVCVVALPESVGETELRELSRQLTELIRERGHSKLVLTFRGNAHTSLHAELHGVLIRAWRRLRDRGGQIRLCEVPAEIREGFRVAFLDQILPIDPDLASAIHGLPRQTTSDRPGTI